MERNPNKVLVALSGGVDSAAAATLLCRAGKEVVGVFMCMGQTPSAAAGRSCCSPRDAADAQAIAARLGVDFLTHDAGAAMERIKDAFCRAYENGRTPNPCILCNQWLKFGALFELADSIGAYFVATGHYARIVRGDGGAALYRAAARDKDQSYALFGAARQRLERMCFPLGDCVGKTQTRAIVKEAGLVVHDKPDSQEICFVPDDDYRTLLAKRAERALRPGPILDIDGCVLGTHNGYGMFTIGQRRGVRVAAAEPLYVCAIDPAACSITIAPRRFLYSKGLIAEQVNWLADLPETFRCTVQIRYNDRGAAALVRRTAPDQIEVLFDQPAFAVTPGQAAVLYDGDKLLGGGWIDKPIAQQ